ncbi:MAG: Stp1/IreP family PP2C-type Ser/Thr phosphatase [Polyangiaceae bacterium]|nr:Stp1/IreP family PP2C-type Ser/Thr phosphatase [Polyangiaceae bacterium]
MPQEGKPACGEPTGPIVLRVFGRTVVGQVREHNEDNFLVSDLTRGSRGPGDALRELVVGPRGMIVGVCDGMGGAAAGEVASQLAVDIIQDRLAAGDPPSDHDELARRLVAAVEEAGIRIFTEARADRTRRGMGTTATIAALVDGRLFVAQVGDSRCYVLRRGSLVQITRDQSLVNQLIEAGQLTEEEAETFEHNNIILQALGTAETVQVDLTYADLRQGDRLILCSDGLSGMIRGEEIREVLLQLEDPEQACKVLIDRANDAGGHDNITAIVALVTGDGLPEPSDLDEPLGYRKYALPEAGSPEQTVRAPPLDSGLDEPTVSAGYEAPGQLKVGHTVVGAVALGERGGLGPSADPGSGPPSDRTPLYSSDEDPVQIPTTGLAPSLVGVMLLGAMLLFALAGFLLLR